MTVRSFLPLSFRTRCTHARGCPCCWGGGCGLLGCYLCCPHSVGVIFASSSDAWARGGGLGTGTRGVRLGAAADGVPCVGAGGQESTVMASDDLSSVPLILEHRPHIMVLIRRCCLSIGRSRSQVSFGKSAQTYCCDLCEMSLRLRSFPCLFVGR